MSWTYREKAVTSSLSCFYLASRATKQNTVQSLVEVASPVLAKCGRTQHDAAALESSSDDRHGGRREATGGVRGANIPPIPYSSACTETVAIARQPKRLRKSKDTNASYPAFQRRIHWYPNQFDFVVSCIIINLVPPLPSMHPHRPSQRHSTALPNFGRLARILKLQTTNMAGSKDHSSAAQYQVSRSRSAERASRTGLRSKSEKRPPAMSQETSLRVPKIASDRVKEQGGPRVRDFQHPESSESNVALAFNLAPMDDNVPTSPDLEVASSLDDDTAPPPPDFTRRGISVPSRTRYRRSK